MKVHTVECWVIYKSAGLTLARKAKVLIPFHIAARKSQDHFQQWVLGNNKLKQMADNAKTHVEVLSMWVSDFRLKALRLDKCSRPIRLANAMYRQHAVVSRDFDEYGFYLLPRHLASSYESALIIEVSLVKMLKHFLQWLNAAGALEYREAAKETYATDELEFDDDAKVLLSADGAFVAAWKWVPKDDLRDPDTDETP